MAQATYDQAVQSLYALGHELTKDVIAKPGEPRLKWELVHMRTLCAALPHFYQNAQTKFPSVLIAGTNGKGSTAATLASICESAGIRVGLYTSPHLSRVNERISMWNGGVGLSQIDDDSFARLYFLVDDTAQHLVREGSLPHPPSFFEVMTALTFAWFAEQHVELAVLEVGLGGRLDATNIVEPLLSIITDIALDHTEYLGNTITEIAREKAGILRENGTLITLPQHPEANYAIGEIAVALNVTGVNAADYMPMRGIELDANRYPLIVLNKEIVVDSPLHGAHQQRNLALAIAAAVTLAPKFGITARNIADGIRNTSWPGRLEQLVVKGTHFLLDVAHNPAGVWALRSVLAGLPENQPKTLIFSCLRDKALTEMAQILFPLFNGAQDTLIIPPIANPRAASVDEILAAALSLETRAEAAESVAAAVARAEAITPENGIVIATGSVYLIGAVREELMRQGATA